MHRTRRSTSDKKLVYEAYKAVKSNGTTGTADQELLLASIKSTPETLTVTFEGFSPTHDFFDYTGKRSALPQPPHDC